MFWCFLEGASERATLRVILDRLYTSTDDVDKGSYVFMGLQVLLKTPHPSTLASP